MSEVPRLAAGVEVSALIRRIFNEGGFATIIRKGDAIQGSILLVLMENGQNPRIYERVSDIEGYRTWRCTFDQDIQNDHEITEFLQKRAKQDPDCWQVELDIAHPERFVAL